MYSLIRNLDRYEGIIAKSTTFSEPVHVVAKSDIHTLKHIKIGVVDTNNKIRHDFPNPTIEELTITHTYISDGVETVIFKSESGMYYTCSNGVILWNMHSDTLDEFLESIIR